MTEEDAGHRSLEVTPNDLRWAREKQVTAIRSDLNATRLWFGVFTLALVALAVAWAAGSFSGKATVPGIAVTALVLLGAAGFGSGWVYDLRCLRLVGTDNYRGYRLTTAPPRVRVSLKPKRHLTLTNASEQLTGTTADGPLTQSDGEGVVVAFGPISASLLARNPGRHLLLVNTATGSHADVRLERRPRQP